jgi:hypothetical protein
VHCTKKFSPFEIINGFNHLTLFDLLPLLINERVSFDERGFLLLYVET